MIRVRVVLCCALALSMMCCVSAQQSRVAIGAGGAGALAGFVLVASSADSDSSSPAIVGGIIALAGSWAAVAGAGSLGPNVRLDRMEQGVGWSPGAPGAAPGVDAGRSAQGAGAWSGTGVWADYAALPRAEQNRMLIERRAVQVVGADPYILVAEPEPCPDQYVALRLIVVTMTEPRHTVCAGQFTPTSAPPLPEP